MKQVKIFAGVPKDVELGYNNWKLANPDLKEIDAQFRTEIKTLTRTALFTDKNYAYEQIAIILMVWYEG